MFNNAYIPYGGYYSSPFCKWQGSLQNENSIKLAAQTSKRFFEVKGFDPEMIEFLYLGHTIIQKGSFFGATWAANEMGLSIPGMSVTHACATSTNTIYSAALAVEAGSLSTAYCMLTDRISNAPHIIWPNPAGPGGEVLSENVNMDNINCDPSTGFGMLTTAENVAREFGFTREEADELTLMRYEQYADALANDRAFQKRYMLPIEIKTKKSTTIISEDEGVTETSKEGLAKLRPVMAEGIHTFGSQTHPADGNAGIIVTTKDRALDLSKEKIPVQVISYGFNRTKKAFMPAAPAGAVQMALEKAGISAKDLVAIKNHSPFISNDLHLAKELGIDKSKINNYGTSLVFGHPQGPTIGRLLIEAIEEAVIKGGGYALACGCAAGDSAAALIVKVG
ncbi:MAG: thiolase family protein [Eubacteriaceae bacterium]|nr:thiolase family protein [Eubacteriaceae bacterium]